MKLCPKCGTMNSDSKFFCVECNEELGDSLTENEESAITRKVNKKLKKSYNRLDTFHVSLFDKIMGIACIISSIILIVTYVLWSDGDWPLIFLILGLLFLGIGIVEAIFPAFAWRCQKFTLSFTMSNSSQAEPSEWYIIARKISEVVCLIVGVGVITILFIIK